MIMKPGPDINTCTMNPIVLGGRSALVAETYRRAISECVIIPDAEITSASRLFADFHFGNVFGIILAISIGVESVGAHIDRANSVIISAISPESDYLNPRIISVVRIEIALSGGQHICTIVHGSSRRIWRRQDAHTQNSQKRNNQCSNA